MVYCIVLSFVLIPHLQVLVLENALLVSEYLVCILPVKCHAIHILFFNKSLIFKSCVSVFYVNNSKLIEDEKESS